MESAFSHKISARQIEMNTSIYLSSICEREGEKERERERNTEFYYIPCLLEVCFHVSCT
jgi:hypothetical protein